MYDEQGGGGVQTEGGHSGAQALVDLMEVAQREVAELIELVWALGARHGFLVRPPTFDSGSDCSTVIGEERSDIGAPQSDTETWCDE